MQKDPRQKRRWKGGDEKIRLAWAGALCRGYDIDIGEAWGGRPVWWTTQVTNKGSSSEEQEGEISVLESGGGLKV